MAPLLRCSISPDPHKIREILDIREVQLVYLRSLSNLKVIRWKVPTLSTVLEEFSVCQSKHRVSFHDPDDETGFGLFGEYGPTPSEVYGFVGSITVVVALVIFLLWAYVPESWLHSIEITYYSSRYWALAVPSYAMVTIVIGLGFYVGLNFMSTPSLATLNTIYDEFSRDPSLCRGRREGH